MAGRLNKKQKEALLEWVAEGLLSDEINIRAAKFKPPFKVLPRVVTYYRKSRKIDMGEIRKSAEFDALRSGLSLKHERVAKLQTLANMIYDDLMGEKTLWLTQVKSLGSGESYEKVDYVEFNTAQVVAFRGLLDDIAKEIGDRGPGAQVSKDPMREKTLWLTQVKSLGSVENYERVVEFRGLLDDIAKEIEHRVPDVQVNHTNKNHPSPKTNQSQITIPPHN